jgi:hypothetical protein
MGMWSRLSRTFHPGRHDEEIEQELQFHLAMKARRRNGRPRGEIEVWECFEGERRDASTQGILVWLESLLRDIRYGLRQLRRSPALTIVVVASLALGSGLIRRSQPSGRSLAEAVAGEGPAIAEIMFHGRIRAGQIRPQGERNFLECQRTWTALHICHTRPDSARNDRG